MSYRLAADAVLLLHAGFIAFVLLGAVLALVAAAAPAGGRLGGVGVGQWHGVPADTA